MVTTYLPNEIATTAFISVAHLNEESDKVINRTFTSYDTSGVTGDLFCSRLKFEFVSVTIPLTITVRTKDDTLGTNLGIPTAESNFKAFDSGTVLQGTYNITSTGTQYFNSECVDVNLSGNTDVRLATVNEGDPVPVSLSVRTASIRHPTTSFRPTLEISFATPLTPALQASPAVQSTPSVQETPSHLTFTSYDPRINGQITATVDEDDQPPFEQN